MRSPNEVAGDDAQVDGPRLDEPVERVAHAAAPRRPCPVGRSRRAWRRPPGRAAAPRSPARVVGAGDAPDDRMSQCQRAAGLRIGEQLPGQRISGTVERQDEAQGGAGRRGAVAADPEPVPDGVPEDGAEQRLADDRAGAVDGPIPPMSRVAASSAMPSIARRRSRSATDVRCSNVVPAGLAATRTTSASPSRRTLSSRSSTAAPTARSSRRDRPRQRGIDVCLNSFSDDQPIWSRMRSIDSVATAASPRAGRGGGRTPPRRRR